MGVILKIDLKFYKFKFVVDLKIEPIPKKLLGLLFSAINLAIVELCYSFNI